MSNKKVIWFISLSILIIGVIFAYKFKPLTMNDIYDKPNFTGTVLDVWDGAILVSVNEDEDEIKSSDKISVPLDVKLKDSITNFQVGDKVRIFYDGYILESYPAKIHTVYAILLINE